MKLKMVITKQDKVFYQVTLKDLEEGIGVNVLPRFRSTTPLNG
jgi:hypothetical protein